jgi:Mor family transcriptional regulator
MVKKYVNANNVLPADLIKEIQKHIEGAYLYIPRTERTAWGVGTGIREELDQRNKQIINSYNNGIEISILAEGYCLSEERVRAIVFGYVSKDKKEEDLMLPPERFDTEKAKDVFCRIVEKNNLSLNYVDVMYLKIRKEDPEETLTYYFNTQYGGTELRDAMGIIVKEIDVTLNEHVCLRQTTMTCNEMEQYKIEVHQKYNSGIGVTELAEFYHTNEERIRGILCDNDSTKI